MMSKHTNVKNYTDKQLLDRCTELNFDLGLVKNKEFLILIRSNEDAFNVYDDKGYKFNPKGKCDTVFTLTTNAGKNALEGGFKRYNKNGVAVIKSDQMMVDAFSFGYHNGRMDCLKQVKDILYNRDGNFDERIDESGITYKANYKTNFHANSYNLLSKTIRWIIGGWSYGCMVVNDIPKYAKMMKLFKKLKLTGKQKYVTIILLKEF